MIKSFLKLVYIGLSAIADTLGYDINIRKKPINASDGKLNLNIGAGAYVIPGFKSLDVYSRHYYKNKTTFEKKRVEYNIRKDNLPYSNQVCDNIYISHVVEHIEDWAVEKFVKEAFRVLKREGVLRIATPDGPFLYDISQFDNNYWEWAKNLHLENTDLYRVDWENLEQYDYLVRAFATQRMRFYNNAVEKNIIPNDDLKGLCYEDLITKLKDDMDYRDDIPGDHINSWSFERLKKIGIEAGFEFIIESKCQGSISKEMQGPVFDRTAPQQSLYVDMIK